MSQVLLAPAGFVGTAPGEVGYVEPAAPPSLILEFYLESAGGRVDLRRSPYRVQDPIDGCDGPEVSELDQVVVPGIDGGHVLGAGDPHAGLSFGVARPTFPVYLDTDDPLKNSEAVAHLRNVLNARRWGPATLTCIRGDGQRRSLLVRHTPQGGDFAPPRRNAFRNPQRVVTVRLASVGVPFWRGVPGSAGPWGTDVTVPSMLPWLYPWRVGSSTVLGQANQVLVGGNELTYPVVTAGGPFSSLQMQHTHEGRTTGYTVSQAAVAGETWTIRHDPTTLLAGVKQATTSVGGASLAPALGAAPVLFPLRPGPQAVSALLGGAQAGAWVQVDWETLYWSAVDD